MKINHLEYTKSLYPHFFDKTDDSNFTKHLKIVGKPQDDIRHKLKTIEWSRILEKPLQIWKTQTKSHIYDMHFKCIVPNIKEINVYKNPILNDEEVVSFEKVDNPDDEEGRAIHKTFTYEEDIGYFEETLSDLSTNGTLKIPSDTFLLEVYTWDDYHFLKGFPENDYTLKEDNILQYRYNETFLSIKLEEISYSKYLVFRVHKDRIKEILIRKNDEPFFRQSFIVDLISTSHQTTDFSYTYFDESITNEHTYNQGEYSSYYEVEDTDANLDKIYFAEQEKDEYVFHLLLKNEDFDDDGYVKDTYDLEVTTFEKRYHCLHEYDRVYYKRYNGYDNQLNDCFDHDYSLDIIGALLNVPRLRLYQVYRNNDYYLSRTYPSYNNRATEDDYHYMKRIQYYISNYNHVVFPVLEFWKWYQTDATILSRERLITEMDNTYIRTNEDGCGTEYLEEEFEEESIAYYSINKATNIHGNANIPIIRGESVWYEVIVVNKVFVVPNVDYRLRYGIKDNTDVVTIRLNCFNRKGTLLRTTPVIIEPYELGESVVEDGTYRTDDDYDYIDTRINIPSDTASIQIVLESDSSFEYTDVTFERVTVGNFDTFYMGTDEDYNSNVYELYANYEDIPSNIRIGSGDRFNALFKRSLPLTKRGYFFIDMNKRTTTTLKANSGFELYLSNILTDDYYDSLGHGDTYQVGVTKYVKGEHHYDLEFTLCIEDIETPTDDDLLIVSVRYISLDGEFVEVLDTRAYTNKETQLHYNFETPEGTHTFVIDVYNRNDYTLENIRLSRVEKLEDDEVTSNDN